MTKPIPALLLLTLLLNWGTNPVFAAISVTTSFKLSVTLPEAIDIPAEKTGLDLSSVSGASKDNPQLTTEKIIIGPNNQRILLRTTVAK